MYELVVLVNVRIDSLNEFSKLIKSIAKIDQRTKIPKIKKIKMKKEILISSSVILDFESNKV